MLAGLALTDRPGDACGPNFPTNLLIGRAEHLHTLWSGSFLEEATRLVPPPPEATPPPMRGDAPTHAELEAYKRGADLWHAKKWAEADRAFRAVLELPADQRRHRSTWAAFMLHDRPLMQRLIRAGFYDEKMLAAFQLGEEARRELGTSLVTAVHLYAQQAAAGDHSGAVSLLMVTRRAVGQPASVTELLSDDVGIRLLAAFYYTRHNELPEGAPKLYSQLRDRALARGVGLDLLAAGAYRDGKWDDAGTFARRAPTAMLSQWVMAKLALRDGDLQAARHYLAEVEAAQPKASELDENIVGDADVDEPRDLVQGDLGLVALADDRFVDAMRWFRSSGHRLEAGYVAERVLTVDELRPQLGDVHRIGRFRGEDAPCSDYGERDPACFDHDLPAVLGRRLMRAGRYDEGIPLLDPMHHAPAIHFALAMRAADAADDPVDRAEQLLAAAAIARTHGMEILGTEYGPDWSMYLGDFSRHTPCAPGQTATDDRGEVSEGCVSSTLGDLPFISNAEMARVAASAPADPHRYHYRFLASKLAEQAADLLPKRSQAFVEALCKAAYYVFDRDRQRVRVLWNRYVREGPAGFGNRFGQTCDAPDFASARTFDVDHAPPKRSLVDRIESGFRHHTWPWVVVLGSLALAGLGLVIRRRREVADPS